MNKQKIFISSVQKEFATERKALANYLRNDPLLCTFFEPFIFEEVPANTHSPGKVYHSEVKESDVYLGLFGEDYGYEDKEGISPTEREYDCAKKEHLPRWIFIKELLNETKRHTKEKQLITKIEQDVSRKIFSEIDSLLKEVYSSCILYLKQSGKIESSEFDSSLHPLADFTNIDEGKVKEFIVLARHKRNFPLRETTTEKQTLTHLNMTRKGKLVNSALLVFSVNPQLFFPAATIKCAHFHGNNVQKPIPDYKEFGGTVFEMADKAVDFVLSKISLSTGTREFENQVETMYEIPRAVIAEAVINAVAHRDYTSKSSIQVSVFKNRIEIFNPGDLPPELDISDLKEPHSSYPHNPLLAACMFLTGEIERFGTGTVDMYNLIRKKGLKPPLISLKEGFNVTIWRPSATTDHVAGHDTIHGTIHDGIHVPAELDLTRRLIMVMHKELSRAEIMDILDLKNRGHFVSNYLEPALSESLIEMTIPNKPKSTKQKYRLTQKGIELKKYLTNEPR